MLNLMNEDDGDRAEFILQCIDSAQKRIAPTWPLDQFIAVNPYWGWSSESFLKTAKKRLELASAPMSMPYRYFLQQWEKGQFNRKHMQEAIDYSGKKMQVETLEAALYSSELEVDKAMLITQLIDQQGGTSHELPWQRFVQHQISQYCASHFDQGQAGWHPDQTQQLYSSWKNHTLYDQGPFLQFGYKRFKEVVQNLPKDANGLIQMVLSELGLEREYWADYLSALLMDINGWAAWCSYVKWQAELNKKQNDEIVELLAIRLAWEWILLQKHPHVQEQLMSAWENMESDEAGLESHCVMKEMLLHAMELAYQQSLAKDLLRHVPKETREPDVQAIFCIDVRSEVFRRALEQSHPKLDSSGFAGFFGLPIAYRQRGTAMSQPQLPGLLAPKYWVSELSNEKEGVRRGVLGDKRRWKEMKKKASSGFSFVETLGLTYGTKLLGRTLASQGLFGLKSAKWKQSKDEAQLALYVDESLHFQVSMTEQVHLVKQILKAMGLTKPVARLILLAGHGAACTNNPHAASLDCGACGGQNGAVNVRMLVSMLNNPELRRLLEIEGIAIPESTFFIAGLHNTTTDAMQLYNLDLVPEGHLEDLVQLQLALAKAGAKTRAERAIALGEVIDISLEKKISLKSQDWAQIRPEWGLANNAAFLVAPRNRSRGLDLKGRVFLHDYAWQSDSGFSILELIMTAPMIVTNWINMQYYASAVDPEHYGSGNKILHNVVGQRMGVFEGNGGDLRIGLPWQSIHNGERLMHTPLRLSVMIEAPQSAITSIMEKHRMVRDLVENRWLHLFQIEDQTGQLAYFNKKEWTVFKE